MYVQVLNRELGRFGSLGERQPFPVLGNRFGNGDNLLQPFRFIGSENVNQGSKIVGSEFETLRVLLASDIEVNDNGILKPVRLVRRYPVNFGFQNTDFAIDNGDVLWFEKLYATLYVRFRGSLVSL